MRFASVKANRTAWPVSVQCDLLGVSRGGYYDWLARPAGTRATRRAELAERIRAVHAESDGT